ncbi:SCO3242 family prenyltransferase [Streptomyces sp. NPDC048441]|uniref:SCO3242 family prenyltransferase n=1 Tax=Streptomyces sp. NPDC048441 TaxID=3365552 RepID=UPI003712CC87
MRAGVSREGSGSVRAGVSREGSGGVQPGVSREGSGGVQPGVSRRGAGGVPLGSARDWAELLRVSALFTVPGDALAGAAATGLCPNRRTLLAIAASLSLYEAGMALNDWADRADDAIERPHRPLPSGRIAPSAALGAAAALTAGGLALAAGAGRPALRVASALAATVWAYDLGLKHTPAGPVAMAGARALDLLLGAAATAPNQPPIRLPRTQPAPAGKPTGPGPSLRAAVPTALVLGAHTLAVTAVSRREAQGGSTAAPLGALAATAALAQLLARSGGTGGPGTLQPHPELTLRRTISVRGAVQAALAAGYAATAARPLFHAALNPSPQLTQRAVGGGIRAMIPLQAALSARAGALVPALLTAALAPAARKFGRKVSVT